MITRERLINYADLKGDLVNAVVYDILEQGDDEEITMYINDVLNYGCVSGVVSSLIYYVNTYEFFKKHFEEILDIAEELKQEYGEINFELNYNNLAWLGYEETVRHIYMELNEEEEI